MSLGRGRLDDFKSKDIFRLEVEYHSTTTTHLRNGIGTALRGYGIALVWLGNWALMISNELVFEYNIISSYTLDAVDAEDAVFYRSRFFLSES